MFSNYAVERHQSLITTCRIHACNSFGFYYSGSNGPFGVDTQRKELPVFWIEWIILEESTCDTGNCLHFNSDHSLFVMNHNRGLILREGKFFNHERSSWQYKQIINLNNLGLGGWIHRTLIVAFFFDLLIRSQPHWIRFRTKAVFSSSLLLKLGPNSIILGIRILE